MSVMFRPVLFFPLLLLACEASVDSPSAADSGLDAVTDVSTVVADDAASAIDIAEAGVDVAVGDDLATPVDVEPADSVDGADATPHVPDVQGLDATFVDAESCIPECDGKSCGDDGCGGFCGTCTGALDVCAAGVCLCVPNCGAAVCGDDGCGGSCGTCALGSVCLDGTCSCVAACDGAVCGPDGCGGDCGYCGEGTVCGGGQCLASCTADCQGEICGDDGCGGSCGDCGNGLECQVGQCQCVPSCVGLACGDDGCGGSCGACSVGLTCQDGDCTCVPSCDGKTCGDDGCGGSCGSCAESDTCAAGVCVTQAVCPPEGPYGTTVGTTVKDLTLMDCDGNPFSLHDLCGENAAYVYSYADWCPICKSLASSTLQQRQDALGPSGLQTVLIVEDGAGGPATAFLCQQVKAKYKLTFPVLYDPTQSFKTHFAQGGPNEINLVLDQGGLVTYLKRYASQVEVEAAIKAALE